MDPTDKIPGVTFFVQSSSLRDKQGQVQLDATVNDTELWDEVLRRLNGHRIYTVSDLTSAMIDVLQEDNRVMREEHTREVAALREQLQQAQQRVSFLEESSKRERPIVEELRKLGLPVAD
jgi:hypothetical protein